MEILEVTHAEEWNAWFRDRAHADFLQFFEWGEFQKTVSAEPVRERFVEKGAVLGQAQAFLHQLPLGARYAYAPRCDMMGDMFALFCEDMKSRGCVFARIEPIHEIATSLPFVRVRTRQPQHTIILDLLQSEETWRSKMHQKTRYNIHLAEKKGVTISEEKNADIFWHVLKDTAARDAFRTHPRAYYESMLACPLVYQLTAYDGVVPIASNILIHAGDTMTYLHGASSSKKREMMAPYLLQFRGMQCAKKIGCHFYDLWGVAPFTQNGSAQFHGYHWDKEHPWNGITRFKTGFGGTPHSYPSAFEVVFRPLHYRLYQFARRMLGRRKVP